MAAGKTYQIDMTGVQMMDTFLRLENPGGMQVAMDDDSGGNLNARIIYTCQQPGVYRISATCLWGTGPFTLKVQER
jgi:hypothetical protein